MGALDLAGVPEGSVLFIDTPPVIYAFEHHPTLAARFRPLFERHADGSVRLAISTITIAEVITGPLRTGDEVLARTYRQRLETWEVVPLDANVAEIAARLRATHRLKLADAIQAASALAIKAAALVTNDQDFARIRGLYVIS